MERTPVISKTGMTGFAFDPAKEILEIEFLSRKEGVANPVYHYSGFKQSDFDAFMAAESKGSHFLKQIKPNFTCKKQEPEKTDGQEKEEGAKDNDWKDDETIPY